MPCWRLFAQARSPTWQVCPPFFSYGGPSPGGAARLPNLRGGVTGSCKDGRNWWDTPFSQSTASKQRDGKKIAGPPPHQACRPSGTRSSTSSATDVHPLRCPHCEMLLAQPRSPKCQSSARRQLSSSGQGHAGPFCDQFGFKASARGWMILPALTLRPSAEPGIAAKGRRRALVGQCVHRRGGRVERIGRGSGAAPGILGDAVMNDPFHSKGRFGMGGGMAGSKQPPGRSPHPPAPSRLRMAFKSSRIDQLGRGRHRAKARSHHQFRHRQRLSDGMVGGEYGFQSAVELHVEFFQPRGEISNSVTSARMPTAISAACSPETPRPGSLPGRKHGRHAADQHAASAGGLEQQRRASCVAMRPALAHRRQQTQAALCVDDGLIGDARWRRDFHQAFGLFGIGASAR